MFKHWKNITIYKLSREADLTDLEDKKKMILFGWAFFSGFSSWLATLRRFRN